MDPVKKESSDPEPKCSQERSPTPNDCAICLDQLKDKSFTNSCLHMFCFHCLEAWSKVKPECPLCKQDFCSIIHNIRSMTDYDEYHVPPVETRLAVTPPFVTPGDMADDYFFSNRRRFFSYRTTYRPHALNIERVRASSLVIQPYVDNLELENNFFRVNAQSAISRLNRTEVYLRELETRLPNTGRHRECSPQFYRDNTPQLHRLVRWIHRELLALSQIGVRFSVHNVEHLIMDMLLIYNLNSTVFHSILVEHLGNHTTRFIRELYSFATSPFEMDQYDQQCTFVRRRNSSHLSFIVTVGRDDSEDVQVIPSTPVPQPVRSWIDVNYVNPSTYQISSSNLPFSSHLSTSNAFNCNSGSAALSTSNAANSIINLTDSDNDDCIIIDNGTVPETIVLDNSDSDDNHSVLTPARTSPLLLSPHSNDQVPLDLSTSRSVNSPMLNSPSAEFSKQTVVDKNSVSSESRSFSTESTPSTPNRLSKLRRRSFSDSSVLSTSISSEESDHSRKRRKSKRASKRKTRKTFSSDEFSHESTAMSAESDSDWEESRRKKRKKKIKKNRTSKREKKSTTKKRKKSAERRLKKRKTIEMTFAVDCDRNEEKLKKPKTTDEPLKTSPKVSSIVKVVHREPDFNYATNLDQPSTSTGYRGCENRSTFSYFTRTVHLSDSD